MLKKYSTSLAAGLVLAGSTVAGAASSNARYQPGVIDCGYVPTVVYHCEDGSRGWFDWETCEFRCGRKHPRKPWVDPAPYDPYRGYRDDKNFNEHMKGMENGVADLRDAIGSGNISGASTQLGGFYSGAASLGTVSAAGAVKTPRWKAQLREELLKNAGPVAARRGLLGEVPVPGLSESSIVVADVGDTGLEPDKTLEGAGLGAAGGAAAGAIAGPSAGVGAAAGAAAGAIGGAYQDVKEYFKTQQENERSYQEGTRAQERIQRKRRGEN